LFLGCAVDHVVTPRTCMQVSTNTHFSVMRRGGNAIPFGIWPCRGVDRLKSWSIVRGPGGMEVPQLWLLLVFNDCTNLCETQHGQAQPWDGIQKEWKARKDAEDNPVVRTFGPLENNVCMQKDDTYRFSVELSLLTPNPQMEALNRLLVVPGKVCVKSSKYLQLPGENIHAPSALKDNHVIPRMSSKSKLMPVLYRTVVRLPSEMCDDLFPW
jgi:hypothetical protein